MENNVTTRIFGWDFEKEMNLLVWRVIRYVTNGLRGFNFQSIWIWLPDIVLKFTVGIVPHMLLCYTCLNCSEFNINCTRRLKRKKKTNWTESPRGCFWGPKSFTIQAGTAQTFFVLHIAEKRSQRIKIITRKQRLNNG